MKKLVFAIAALGLFSMTSCKKEYTCACTIAGVTTDAKSGEKLKKSDAETWCNQLNTGAKITGGSCTLK